mgnify:CR=1 FL=1
MDFNLKTETEEQTLIDSVRNTLTEQGDALRHLAEVIDATSTAPPYR